MQPQSKDPVDQALALANGLRRQIASGGRRWSQWPGGDAQLAKALAAIEAVLGRLGQARGDAAGAIRAVCVTDLRAILEWSTYQSGALATARAIAVARRTHSFAERFGLLAAGAGGFAALADSEESLLENIRTKNGYMAAIAERHPHLRLPPPLVLPERLAVPAPKRTGGRLAFIQQITQSVRDKSAKPTPPKKPR